MDVAEVDHRAIRERGEEDSGAGSDEQGVHVAAMLGAAERGNGFAGGRDPEQSDHRGHRHAKRAHVRVAVIAGHYAQLGLLSDVEPGHARPGHHQAEPAVDVQLLDLDADRVPCLDAGNRDRPCRRIHAARVEQVARLVSARDRPGPAVMRLDHE